MMSSGSLSRRQRHHEDALREIAQAQSPAEVALGTDSEFGQEAPRHDHVDVIDADAEQRGAHAPERLAQAGVLEVEVGATEVVDRLEARPLRHHLQGAAHQGPDGHGQNALLPPSPEPARQHQREGDEGDVQERRGEGGDDEALIGVQCRHTQGGRAHEEDVGEHPAGELDRAFELPRLVAKPSGEQIDELGSEQHPEQAHREQDQQ